MTDRLGSIVEYQLLAELKHVIRVSKSILVPLSVESEEMYARYYSSTENDRFHNYNVQQAPYHASVNERVIPTFIEYAVKLLTEHGYNKNRYNQLLLNAKNNFEWEDQFDYRYEKYLNDLNSICQHAVNIAKYFTENMVLQANSEWNLLRKRFRPYLHKIETVPIKLDLDELHKKVTAMLLHAKSLIENNGIWKSVSAEKSVQRLIYSAVSASCKMDNIDLSPETDSGNGPVDMKFSHGFDKKIVVEIKLSSNGRALHGYEKQLEIYKQSDSTNRGIFVLVDVGSMGNKLNKIKKVHDEFLAERGIASDLIVIDSTEKLSASIRK